MRGDEKVENYRCPRCGDKSKEIESFSFIKYDRANLNRDYNVYDFSKFICRNCNMVFYVWKYGKEIE